MTNNLETVRVRVAPSPTGFLHVGTAQSALFNWLFARHTGGIFFVRIEDTDTARSEKRYEEDILDGLKWLGLVSDEPPFRQSDRLEIYRSRLEQLLESGKAYWKHYTKEELEAMSKDGRTPNRDSVICLAKNENPGRIISFDDQIRGEIKWEERLLGDLVIAKDIDTPLYNFAVVVDDIDMKISHVIRGEDHISNTPKQLLIYEAFGATPPNFAHLPLLLGTDRSKLSKRHGATSLAEFKKDYLPEALVNFLGSLGYTYSQEIMSLVEMAQEFDLRQVHKSGAVFDIQKLNWFNTQYAKNLSIEKLRSVTGQSKLPDLALSVILERLEKLSDVKDFSYLWEKPEYPVELLVWKSGSLKDARSVLEQISQKINRLTENFDENSIRSDLESLSESAGGRGPVYWPLRVSLSGREKSADPIQIAMIIGKVECMKRIKEAIVKLDSKL